MKKLLLLTVAVLTVYALFSFSVSKTENYDIIRTIDSVEIRQYPSLIYASHYSEQTGNNSQFRVLANYIFGANETAEEIAMTSPVVIRLFNDDEMLFRMPEKYNKKNLPKPNNENVKFIETNYVQKAVIKYSGYSNTEKENEKIKELKTILEKYNIPHNNKFELFVYDPPYKFFNRRNEISVNVLK